MNRRNFLRGFAGLAALAVAGPSLAALTKTDRERLIEQMRSGGVIENQTFYIRDGGSVVLEDMHNLTIRNCRFIWTTPCKGSLIVFGKGCVNCCIDHCSFDGGHRGPYVPVAESAFFVEVDSPNSRAWDDGIRWSFR